MSAINTWTQFEIVGDFAPTAVVAQLNDNLGMTPLTKPAGSGGPIPNENVRQGIHVLKSFQDLRLLDRFIETWLEVTDGRLIFAPVYRIWWTAISQNFQGMLSGFGEDSILKHTSELICRNTSIPMRCNVSMSVQDWALQATGVYLRWETLGLLFAYIGHFFTSNSNCFKAVFTSDGGGSLERQAVAQRMASLAKQCLSLCSDPNDLFLCLLLEYTLVLKLVEGELSSNVWNQAGRLCEQTVLLGLHQEKRLDADAPFYLCELRVRLFSRIYALDKTLCTSLGRPPRISHRHCALQMIHDMTDEEVCLQEPEVSMVVCQLQGGWSVSGELRNAGWFRARSQHTVLREEILEVALGSFNHDLELRIPLIRQKVMNCLEAYPEWARISPEEALSSMSLGVNIPGRNHQWRRHDILHLFILHNWVRQTLFLLERAIVRRRDGPSTDLINAALRLLQLALKTYGMKDNFYECFFQADVLLVFYALPPASILALELLADAKHCPTPSLLPHSEVIQQLSVLVHCLDAVEIKESKYEICRTGLHAVRRVLDLVLVSSNQQAYSTDNTPTSPVQLDSKDDCPVLGQDESLLQWLAHSEFHDGSWQDFATVGL